MREIKFRAWDKEINKYRKDGQIQLGSDGQPFVLFASQFGNLVVEEIVNVIIELYTGLKDKNGVEIYEGDICTAEAWSDDCFHEVVFADCAFCTKTDGVDYCNDMTLFMCSKYEHSSLTIIGNIHDNPELLKGTQ